MEIEAYDHAQVIAGLNLLGEYIEDPDWERRADLVLALRSIHRTRAIACILFAKGYSTSEIGRYFMLTQRGGSKLLRTGLNDLKERMNAQTCAA